MYKNFFIHLDAFENKIYKLSVTDENADVYIRAVSPDEIEYAVSKNGVPGKNAECIRIKLEI